MAEDFEEAIREYLRKSEEFRLALEVRLPPQEPSGDAHDPQESVWDSSETKRFLAVVTHLDTTTGDEQGCIFVFNLRSKRSNAAPNTYLLEHVFPILGHFSISMAQPRRSTINLSSPPDLSKIQPRTEIALTVNPGHDLHNDSPLSLLTRDTVQLRAVLKECKRLRELSIANNPDVLPPYLWVLAYTHSEEPAILSPVPSDLRQLQQQPHEHLSAASAGQPGDDIFDISLLREEWIKQKVHDLHASARNKIRLGTFNVNGKLPSQDLSPWVRGRVDQKPSIPSLKNVSPLSMGEVVKSSGEYFNDAPGEKTDRASTASSVTAFSTSSATTTASTATLQTSGTTTQVDDTNSGKPENSTSASDTSAPPSYLSDDRRPAIPDPDILVLAFQELDLSTEALLYSTKTTREEAWCAAALAGLGEKAVQYEKLASKQLVGMLLVLVVRKPLKSCFGDVKATSVGAGILGLMGNKGGTAIRLTFTPPATPDAPVPQPIILTFVNAHLAAFDEMFERRNADFQDLSKRLQFDSGIPVQDSPTEEDGYPLVTVPLSVYQTDALFWLGDLNYRINLSDADVRVLLAEASEPQGLRALLNYDQLGLAIRTKKAFANFVEAAIHHPPHNHTVTRSLEFTNVGKIPCAYRFVAISIGAPVHPEWLHIEPLTGLLLPGEKKTVSLTAVLDNSVVGRLNSGVARLDDTLILHTLLGKDHFVSITAQYKRTCFATSLNRLVRLTGPVRSADKMKLLPEEQALNAPREIMRLVNWLMSNATDIPGLFLLPGDQELVAEIRECLDTGAEFGPHAEEDGPRMAVAFATCLLEFLDTLPESVIPLNLHARCAQATDREQAFQLLDELPGASVNVWISVTAFLHFISQQAHSASDSPTSDAGQLARVFASVLLRDDLTTSTPVSPVGKRKFVGYFVG
ncbi:hypothetical protein EUX98_g1340 [Antrodiella citrinella]|uniref:Rho-GAP domain-containing protein n=1 Tax=Antrodiella citrinella TaxID=2447956 RepID=A0A4S4N1S6_9APHY|nr:hypothetical protein EUX98_g1340 [Antrodiella citrinella]